MHPTKVRDFTDFRWEDCWNSCTSTICR